MIDMDATVNDLLDELPENEGVAMLRFDPEEDVLLFLVRGTLARTMREDVREVMEKFKAAQL